MSPRPIRRIHFNARPALRIAAAILFLGLNAFSGEPVTLHLKNGDRITGFIVSESAGEIVLSNRWTRSLSVPLEEVARRDDVPPATVAKISPTNVVVVAKPVPPGNIVAVQVPPPARPWKGEAQVGLNLLYGRKEQQIYHGRLKLSYSEPYNSDPARLFRNTLDGTIEYGRTDGEKSTDRMNASDKIDVDLFRQWYAYNLAGIGYDYIKRVNLQYEEGAGIGYHVIARTNLTLNAELGASYQSQDRDAGEDSRDVYYRLANDLSWKLGARTTFTERLEVFPRWNFTELRLRFETTLAYEVWKNISLNITVRDLFDTKPAEDVSENELQIRSSLGVKF